MQKSMIQEKSLQTKYEITSYLVVLYITRKEPNVMFFGEANYARKHIIPVKSNCYALFSMHPSIA